MASELVELVPSTTFELNLVRNLIISLAVQRQKQEEAAGSAGGIMILLGVRFCLPESTSSLLPKDRRYSSY